VEEVCEGMSVWKLRCRNIGKGKAVKENIRVISKGKKDETGQLEAIGGYRKRFRKVG